MVLPDASVPDTAPRGCRSDIDCNDGLYCTGVERCDLVKGCIATAPACDDAIACTDDSCDEAKRACKHAPDDSKCPISKACDPKNGCEQRAFAHSDTMLYDIRLPSGTVKVIGATGAHLTDIALHPNNTLYGFSYASLWTCNQSTGYCSFVRSLADSVNGADVDPNGTMYVAGTSSLYTMDIGSGALTFIESFPNGEISSGDLAFVGSRLYATAHSTGGFSNDTLVEFDVANKTSKVIGTPGGCIWTLAAYAQTLYGMTCNGDVLSIDTAMGKGTMVSNAMVKFWGATAR